MISSNYRIQMNFQTDIFVCKLKILQLLVLQLQIDLTSCTTASRMSLSAGAAKYTECISAEG